MIFKDKKLSHFTTLRIGGPPAALFEAASPDAVVFFAGQARSMGLHFRVIGEGSNLFASERGTKEAIIVYRGCDAPQAGKDGRVRVLGGTSLDLLVGFLVERGLGGLENLAGIPGTVGGAIYGNAGAYGSCISDRLLSATLLGKDGAIREATPAGMSFEYRHSILKESGEAVLEAIFETTPANRDALRNAMNERKTDRARKHPDPAKTPTAGSWFKNIKDREGNATPAGRLLEEAGCCELSVGGASLWPSHANIIVTDGNASWFHVDELVSEMKRRVKERFGIDLVEEVSRIGC